MDKWSRERLLTMMTDSLLGIGAHAVGDLVHKDFSGADLSGLDLQHIRMRNCKFVGANLKKTDFTNAFLEGSDFRRADLTKTCFLSADLRNAKFAKATLVRTDFSYATLDGASFKDVDLTKLSYRVPVLPNIDAAILAALDVPENELDMTEWHVCDAPSCARSTKKCTGSTCSLKPRGFWNPRTLTGTNRTERA